MLQRNPTTWRHLKNGQINNNNNNNKGVVFFAKSDPSFPQRSYRVSAAAGAMMSSRLSHSDDEDGPNMRCPTPSVLQSVRLQDFLLPPVHQQPCLPASSDAWAADCCSSPPPLWAGGLRSLSTTCTLGLSSLSLSCFGSQFQFWFITISLCLLGVRSQSNHFCARCILRWDKRNIMRGGGGGCCWLAKEGGKKRFKMRIWSGDIWCAAEGDLITSLIPLLMREEKENDLRSGRFWKTLVCD